MFGRQARLPIDLMYGTRDTAGCCKRDYAVHWKEGIEKAYWLVWERLGASHQPRQDYYDKQVHGDPFEENQLVWLHSPVIPQGHSRKLHHPWIGPYQIIKRLLKSDYKIKNVDGNGKSLVVDFDRLNRAEEPGLMVMKRRTSLMEWHLLYMTPHPVKCLVETWSSLRMIKSYTNPVTQGETDMLQIGLHQLLHTDGKCNGLWNYNNWIDLF